MFYLVEQNASMALGIANQAYLTGNRQGGSVRAGFGFFKGRFHPTIVSWILIEGSRCKGQGLRFWVLDFRQVTKNMVQGTRSKVWILPYTLHLIPYTGI